MSTEFKLTEAEHLLIEKFRLLCKSDITFTHLAYVTAMRWDILVERGKKYNRNGEGVMDQMFYMGDQSAFHNSFRPCVRLKAEISSGRNHIEDDAIQNALDDAPNYMDMWRCCREERKIQRQKGL